jgi:hypothetical protein
MTCVLLENCTKVLCAGIPRQNGIQAYPETLGLEVIWATGASNTEIQQRCIAARGGGIDRERTLGGETRQVVWTASLRAGAG